MYEDKLGLRRATLQYCQRKDKIVFYSYINLQRLTNKIKMVQTTSIPVERYSGNLKMEMLERKCGSNSAQILHYSECLDKVFSLRNLEIGPYVKQISLKSKTDCAYIWIPSIVIVLKNITMDRLS